ncbi:hypothetical protein C900_03314 [Fulvivirga imtechensis AK7]|uniref:Uncharacterized protein n=1 Tax=Fulvivirga imtechensis AK7 TaxID=1237149 RepID=L8JTN4_9BACT|nr:hypothetical protein C900_03314 [Fulvivirga imtechensis AK7]
MIPVWYAASFLFRGTFCCFALPTTLLKRKVLTGKAIMSRTGGAYRRSKSACSPVIGRI